MRVVVFTTSWPRSERDWVGRFVADAVTRVRELGVEVDVVRPGVFRDFGLAYGDGVVANARRKPWRAPFMLASMVRTLRRHARRGGVVHAHWLLGGLIARLSGAPYVVTLHGSGSAGRFADLNLARRAPRFVGWILGGAEVVIAVSTPLAEAARACGASDVRVIPNGVDLPERPGVEDDPPFVLFAGRLSREKGVDEFVAATKGLSRLVAGDGPLRDRVPADIRLGFLPHDDLLTFYDRAAVLCMPSRSEGFGVAAVEAMAAGTPVVATRVGGLVDVVEHERTGLLVEEGDVDGLRAALVRLLDDPDLRARLGSAARQRVAERFGWPAVAAATVDAYRSALHLPAAEAIEVDVEHPRP